MRITCLAALVFSAQAACTIGAPAMNDPEGTGSIVEQLSVARRGSLPTCTVARDSIRAYVREERYVATCSNEAWHDPHGNIVEIPDGGPTTADPASTFDVPATDAGPGTVASP